MKGRGREAPHQDERGSVLDSVLPVIQCDYGNLTDVGEEPEVALSQLQDVAVNQIFSISI